ncbi:MAG: 16S rRNA (guanine(966)-N(2))-methyltransferase RsmD [Granulosicoccus sp.]
MTSRPAHRHSVKSRKGDAARSPGAVVGQVRIIGGQWRGRRLAVVDQPGLRPTGNRIRETLFNWLQPCVAGASCLDLFAGSGALGFEAMSRYASRVVFVEPNPVASQALLQSCSALQMDARVVSPDITDSTGTQQTSAEPEITVFAGAAEQFLQLNTALFDIVFVDPPFDLSIQWTVLEQLVAGNLAHNALVYVESPVAESLPCPLPGNCVAVKEKVFGDVRVCLLRFSPL